MKIAIAEKEFNLSKAQSFVVQLLLDNRGNEDVFVAPCPYYNHQKVLGVGKYGEQFKRPTLEYLVEKKDSNTNRPQKLFKAKSFST